MTLVEDQRRLLGACRGDRELCVHLVNNYGKVWISGKRGMPFGSVGLKADLRGQLPIISQVLECGILAFLHGDRWPSQERKEP